MSNLLEQFDILFPAFLAGLLVMSTHVPMGQEVLKRGIIFLDLAIAQIAALGIILAGFMGFELHDNHSHEFMTQLVAIGAAVAGASLLYQFRHATARTQEALIGTLFMLAATGSILLLAKDPHGGERLKEILVGQILWVEYSSLMMTAAVYIPVIVLWFVFKHRISGYLFYPLFAIAITLSTQLVGVYLVFASLIVPTLASQLFSRPLLFAYIISVLGYLLGLVLSALYDLPSGATIAWCLSFMALVFFLVHVKFILPNSSSN